MKKLLILLFTFIVTFIEAQTPVTLEKGSINDPYVVTGNIALKATQSIVLKPNTHIKAGSTFRAYIAQDAYLPLSLSNENYILTRVFQTPTKTTSVAENKDVIESVTYYDGLGRAKQTVGIKQSPTKKDIVTHIEYDAMGRQTEEFLPYLSANSNGSISSNARISTQNYYKTHYVDDFPGITDVSQINAYSEKEFDGSPLNRVMKQSAPGAAWKLGSGKEIKFDYQTNTSNEVREYYVTTTVSDKVYTPTLQLNTASTNNNGFYNAGELYKTITKDEHHSGTNKIHTTEEFKNKQGQVVLKRTYITNTERADTYYVYDDFGNLTYVLSPKSKAHTAKPDAVQLSELCYQYEYDYRNRLVEKKVPGKGWEYIVYDKLDRPVLTQDANQRTDNQRKWLFTKYDVLGRVVYTGMYTHGSNITQAQMQSYFDSQNEQNQSTASAKMYEKKLTSSGIQGSYYSNNNFPKLNIELLTINYYDNYTFNRAGTGTSVNSYGVVSTSRLKGLATGSRVKVLGESNKWITTVTYYDEKARPIYVYTKNDFLLSTDIVKSKLDFSGKVEETTTIHTKTDGNLPTITTLDKYSYDHRGRVTQHTQTIGGRTEVIAVNEYDNLGQLKKKNVGGIDTRRNRLQNIDYIYNIRGWLERINNTSNLGNDLFAFKINYNKPTHGNTNTGLFNGNISETEWRTKNDNALRWYKYSYDPLNRIKSAVDDINGYSLSSVNYDENGNIETLKRNGHTRVDSQGNITEFGLMDNLKYTYANNNKSNRLIKVEELQGGNPTHGFKDGNRSGDDYTYDANGNMVKDENKGITKIIYNHLNLPKSVTLSGGTINYTYDATGVKLRKTVSSTITDYAGNYIYKKEGTSTKRLEFFNHPEGYVKNDNGTFNYVYQYKDHLGNVRLSYTDANNDGNIAQSEIIEESNYYPFGLRHKGYNNVTQPHGNSIAQKFKYQGQELEEELGKNTYAYQWRDYDPAIARFNKIDRFAEKYMKNSPYSFTANNPIYFREIAGDSIDVSRALVQDRKALTKVVKDLQTKTGLTFTLKKGKLVYKKDADGNAIVSKDADGNSIGSESARNLVTGALDNSKTANLSFGKLENGNVGVAGTSSVDGMEHIVLDPSNIDKMISGSSKGLNNTTFGFAMSFMHEIDHTSIGVSKTGHGAESTTFGLTGTVVDNMNKIRRELGSSYGQRTSYSAMKTYSGNFIPFSTSSLSTLKSNPTPGILSILSNGNSKALNKIYLSIKF